MENFRAQILKETRELMNNENQSEISMKSWQGSEIKGFELMFTGTKRGVPTDSGVVAQIFISEDGGFEAIITGYLLKNGLRSIAASFTVVRCSSLSSQLTTGLHPLTLAVGSTLTLNHLLMLDSVRDKILKHLNAKEAARMAQTSRTAHHNMTCHEVDRTFWKDRLKEDFGAAKVRETIAKGRKFYGVYCDEAKNRAQRAHDEVRVGHNPLLIGGYQPPRYDLLGVPDRGGMRPFHPDSEFFNPQGGFLPPGVPRGNPQIPDLFQGQNHPDLNPLGGGFGAPRGGGSQGRPFMRGPGGGGFGGSGGSGFI